MIDKEQRVIAEYSGYNKDVKPFIEFLEKAPAGTQGFGDWDAGVRVRLSLQQGAFSMSAGWMRGLVDLMPGAWKAYNNSFRIGVALSLGY